MAEESTKRQSYPSGPDLERDAQKIGSNRYKEFFGMVTRGTGRIRFWCLVLSVVLILSGHFLQATSWFSGFTTLFTSEGVARTQKSESQEPTKGSQANSCLPVNETVELTLTHKFSRPICFYRHKLQPCWQRIPQSADIVVLAKMQNGKDETIHLSSENVDGLIPRLQRNYGAPMETMQFAVTQKYYESKGSASLRMHASTEPIWCVDGNQLYQER